jgi:CheY-like chemotaxis protein
LVLVAEDDPAVRRVAVTILRSLGYRVIEAADGEQAMSRAQDPSQQVQLVVTDIVMPRLGGVGLAEQLRSAQPNLPVVFTSGYSEEFRPAEMPPRSSFLPKPYTPDDLADQVRKLLDVGAGV